jgi:hypothetical protein
MTPVLPTAGIEFLEHYRHDARYRWSAEDLAAQQEFVNSQLAGKDWLDGSTEAAAFQLWQADAISASPGLAGEHDAILWAGPLVELFDLAILLECAAKILKPGGQVIGIVPCLRDNSPESQLFAQFAAETFRPYPTAEELREVIQESGFNLPPDAGQFVTISALNEAVLKDQLAFKGFQQIFRRLLSQGYDPIEVGWGELRFVATLYDVVGETTSTQ